MLSCCQSTLAICHISRSFAVSFAIPTDLLLSDMLKNFDLIFSKDSPIIILVFRKQIPFTDKASHSSSTSISSSESTSYAGGAGVGGGFFGTRLGLNFVADCNLSNSSICLKEAFSISCWILTCMQFDALAKAESKWTNFRSKAQRKIFKPRSYSRCHLVSSLCNLTILLGSVEACHT